MTAYFASVSYNTSKPGHDPRSYRVWIAHDPGHENTIPDGVTCNDVASEGARLDTQADAIRWVLERIEAPCRLIDFGERIEPVRFDDMKIAREGRPLGSRYADGRIVTHT